jgi:hypothetical protein
MTAEMPAAPLTSAGDPNVARPVHRTGIPSRSTGGRGEPYAALRSHKYHDFHAGHHGQPARRLSNPITRRRAPARPRFAETDAERGTRHMFDANRRTLMAGRCRYIP